MNLDYFELKCLLIDAMEIGATRALTEAGVIKPYLTKSEAYRKYGRRIVDRWIRERLIIPIKDGTDSAKVRLDRMQLEAISKSANRVTYMTTVERSAI